MASMTERRTKNTRDTSLRFPLDTENANTFMSFQTVEYTKIVKGLTAKGQAEVSAAATSVRTVGTGNRPSEGLVGEATAQALRTTLSALTAGAKFVAGAIVPEDMQDGVRTTYNAIDHGGELTPTLGRSVDIFMPQSIQINDSAAYDSTALGGAGRMIGAVTSNKGIPGMSEAAFAIGEGIGSIANLFKEDGAGMSNSQLAAVANKIPGGSELRAAASHGFGVTLDPVNITTFQGVGIRQFSFTYKFIPSSQSEAFAIRDIIKFFRTELYPEKSGWALKYPNAFEIRQVYIPGNSRPVVLNEFLKSFLVSVSTTYNPTSNAMMSDGSWSETDLTLTFQEERSMHKNDVMNEKR